MTEEQKKPSNDDYEDAEHEIERDELTFESEQEKKEWIEKRAWQISRLDPPEHGDGRNRSEESEEGQTTGPSKAAREDRNRYGILPLYFHDFMKHFAEARYKVFIVLWTHVSWRDKWCPVSIKDIAEDAGLKLQTTSEAISWLNQFGFWRYTDFAEPKQRRYDSAKTGRRVFGARYKFRGPGKLPDGRYAFKWRKIDQFIKKAGKEKIVQKAERAERAQTAPEPFRDPLSGRFMKGLRATIDYLANLGEGN